MRWDMPRGILKEENGSEECAMEIHSREQGRKLTIFLKGELDHHGAKQAMEQIGYAIDAALPRSVVLDFGEVDFMDSSGIAVVLKTQRRISSSGGVVQIVNASQQVRKVFDAAGLSRIIAMK